MRADVLNGTGLTSRGNLNASYQPIVDYFIRDAHDFLFEKASWLRGRARHVQDITDGETDYDFPDDGMPGRIERVAVRNTSGREIDLQCATPGDARSAFSVNGDASNPRYYEFRDGVIKVYPAGNGDPWSQLVIDYQRGPARLRADTDRPTVYGPAVVKLAVIKLKDHLGTGGDMKMEMSMFLEWIESIRNNQGEPRVIDMRGAPNHAWRFNDNAWHDGWNPWPG